MADESAVLLDFTSLHSGEELYDFLEENNYLANLDEFRQKFLGRLVAYLEDPSNSSPFLSFGEETLIAAEALRYLPELLDNADFLQALGITSLNSPLLEKARTDLTIEAVIGRKEAIPGSPIEVPFINRGQAFDTAEQLKRLYRRLVVLAGQVPEDTEPEYEEALDAALNTALSDLTNKKNALSDSLRHDKELALDSAVQGQLTSRWREVDSETSNREKGQVSTILAEHQKAFSAELEEWRKQVLSFQDQESKNKIDSWQQEGEIQGLLGKKGLLEFLLSWVNNGSLPELLEAIKHHCISLVEPFNPRRAETPAEQAELDLELTLERLFKVSDELEQYLNESKNGRVKAHEKKFSDAVSAELLGATTSATDTDIPGGDSSQIQEPDPHTPPHSADGAVDALASKWLLVAEAWRSSWNLLENLEDTNTSKQALSKLLEENNLRPENLLSFNFDFASFFAAMPPQRRVQSAEQADRILELLNQIFPEGQDVAEPPGATTPQSPQRLQTAFSTDAPLDPRSEKLQTIGQISRAKAELVQFTLLQLRLRLADMGYSQSEITAYLELYEAQISSQIWIALLDKNGLHEKLSLADLVAIEKNITDQYFTFISKAYPPQNPRKPLGVADANEAALRAFLERSGLDPDLYLQQFSRQALQRALAITEEFSRLTLAERITLVTDLLQDRMDQSTARSLAQIFTVLASGGSIVDYTTFFDQLSQQLYQKNWGELSNSERERISGYINYFYENSQIFGLVIGLSDLRDLKSKVSQLQTLFQRMQAFRDRPLALTLQNFGTVRGDDAKQRGVQEVVLQQEFESSSRRDVTLQVSVIFALEIQPEIREGLLTLVMQQPVSMQEFGGLLEYAQTGEQPAEPLNARLMAQLENFQRLQQENPEAFAEQQQQAYQQFSQAEYNRKRIEVALKLIRAAAQAYAGNPTALISLLSDKQSREIIQKEIQKWGLRVGVGAAGTAAYSILSPLISIVSGVTSFLTSIGLLGQGAGTAAANAISSTGSLLGSEALSEAATTTAAGASKELTALNKSLADLGNTLSQVPGQVSTAASTLGIGKSLAIVAFSSIFGPIILAGVLTIIVITVIGGSLNDFPLGVVPNGPGAGSGVQGRLARFNGRVCWPTNGRISQFDTPAHNTWGEPNIGSALDISGTYGEPIYTPYSGTVLQAGAYENLAYPGYGYWVHMRTDEGFELIFAHMAGDPTQHLVDRDGDGNLEPAVVVGGRLEAGDPVGLMASTGTGSVHLHYEVPQPPVRIRDVIPPVPPLPPASTPISLSSPIMVRVGMCGLGGSEELENEEEETIIEDKETDTIPPTTSAPAPGQPSPQDLLQGNFGQL